MKSKISNFKSQMKKVLIIDDDPGIREALKTILEGQYDVQEADNATDGRKALQSGVPDLVMLDVMMEDLDSGFQLSREIRQDDRLANVKILMLTSADQEMGMDFEKYAGDSDWLPVDGYLTKPIKPKELLAKIEKLL